MMIDLELHVCSQIQRSRSVQGHRRKILIMYQCTTSTGVTLVTTSPQNRGDLGCNVFSSFDLALWRALYQSMYRILALTGVYYRLILVNPYRNIGLILIHYDYQASVHSVVWYLTRLVLCHVTYPAQVWNWKTVYCYMVYTMNDMGSPLIFGRPMHHKTRRLVHWFAVRCCAYKYEVLLFLPTI